MSLAALIERWTAHDTVTVSRRSFTAGAALALALVAWALATGCYFLFRDDITAGLLARQSAMQQAYEEKLGTLRAHLDRLASQTLLDQDGLDKRVAELAARQGLLETRQAFLTRLSDAVQPSGSLAGLPQDPEPAVPFASPPPAPAGGPYGPDAVKPMPVPESFDLRLRQPDGSQGKPRTSERLKMSARDRLAQLQRSLEVLEGKQIHVLDRLSRAAEARLGNLRDAVREAGLNPDGLEAPLHKGGMGGPLVPITEAKKTLFEGLMDRVQTGLERLRHFERAVVALPFARPVPGDVDLTSGFGYRIDPFTRGPAMHTGLDFRAEHGAPVRAGGAGQVVAAEYAGGYGNMVEIDHGNGVTTRYAHLSAIAVSAGETVAAGAVLGRAGSTGRSTGPHLHYETRIDGEAVDPQRFLRAGTRIAARNESPPR
jgi:murein DD-endopeptidase MepM/ murein hydrolase activator NlpD